MAVRIAARFQPGPGTVALRVADDEEERGRQERQPIVLSSGVQLDQVIVEHQVEVGAGRQSRQILPVRWIQVTLAAFVHEQGADVLPDGAHLGQVDAGTAQQAGLFEPLRARLGVRQEVHARIALPGIDEGLHEEERHRRRLRLHVGDPGGQRHPTSLAPE